MKKFFLKINRWCLKLAVLAVLLLPEFASAQYFTYNDGDLLLGFRKTSGTTPYDLVVNVGSVTNYLAMAPGTTIAISQFSPSQLSDAFSDYNNLSWSASAAWNSVSSWSGFPYHTYWVSVPRSNPIIQSTPPQRAHYGTQGVTFQYMNSIGGNAVQISQQFIGSTGPDNNTVLVREPTGSSYDSFDYHYFVADTQNSTIGNFRSSLGYNAENTTPASFTNVVAVSDLYQSVPIGGVDPTTGTTNGAAYYVGYFALKAGGTMTFTRASATPPPAPQITSITRENNTTTVSFTTANGAIYALLGTNSAGLTLPVANWLSPSSLIGDGNTDSLSETTTSSSRLYRVGAGN